MEGLSKFRECWGRVAAGHLGARHASPPSFPVALNLSWPWGYRDSIFLLGMALLFSDGLCLLFPGVVVLSSSFLSCPSHPEGRVVITGLLCLWWAGQRPCLQGGWAPIPPLPHFSASQGLPCSWGSTFGLWNRLCWGHDAPVGRITSWRRVLVLVPSCLLPASSLPQFHQSCCSLETSLYVPGRGQVACRWGIDRACRLVPHVSTTAA